MSLKIHKIIEGPVEDEDDVGPYYFMDVYAEFDGEFFEMTLQSREFNKMYSIVRHMKSSTIDPYIVEVESTL